MGRPALTLSTYQYVELRKWERHNDARHSHHHVPLCLLHSWKKRELVVGCHGVAAVLWVTAVIIMQLTEGTAAKTFRLLPKHHNTGGSSMPAVMCLAQDSRRGGRGEGWIYKAQYCDSRVQGLRPNSCWLGSGNKSALVKACDFGLMLIITYFKSLLTFSVLTHTTIFP